MSSKSKQQQTTKKKRSKLKVSQTQRTLGYVVFSFFLGAAVGFMIAFNPQAKDDGEQTDAYGRSPGHEHYLHKHP